MQEQMENERYEPLSPLGYSGLTFSQSLLVDWIGDP